MTKQRVTTTALVILASGLIVLNILAGTIFGQQQPPQQTVPRYQYGGAGAQPQQQPQANQPQQGNQPGDAQDDALADANSTFAAQWPVEVTTPQGTLTIFQPQMEDFEGNVLSARAAVS